ncbi:MAG TPA: recombinase family protein [Candidatus Companilactobacillus pullicola]|uniref:Recombinase family protein n=1 Tax=Candidatus Companilactobacillus pullicola TaxID=2838523 RepID=A0A9D1ZSG5_9LACO|nr:recombinase family protein [Candidatus Companilactobacillus pullicola]
MKIGYARVSTVDQNLVRQIVRLKEEQVDLIYKEKLSGKDMERPQLKRLLKRLTSEDEVYVVSLDRLGRNSDDITRIINQITIKGAFLNVLDLPTFEGIKDHNLKRLLTNLILEIKKYDAEQERKMIRERQRQGIEQAKLAGKYKGKRIQYSADSPKKKNREIYFKTIEMLKNGIPKTKIANRLGISKQTVYNILRRDQG